ncbi:diphthamide biosynthesis enzyme Dph2 [Candidatus Methanosphaera massiliense]|jgi:2-(3-amino-3-carboxypropyl)histidine synthase|uniref:diphthamide biosynthesis enzyme Dph2 n=1 Tax=Methanosphaera TaxID=2316 RepID=UPI002380B9C0|nr:diphthamide biosynthesis enzyme Dph2 [Candidatus Methanosphaera massiliense]MDD6285908.1 diphthamide biosynthesis enzyme Dph2 [Methanobacteriaceae archaeon]MDE4077927.1 diphthamide biosynthesis enzyme Dph2 [Candidatus Methanosphaera massiliense]
MSTIDYDYKIDTIKDKIQELNAKNVILQFPEGLKTDAIMVAEEINSVVNDVNIIIDADPCFGACDLADNKVNGHIDLVVHFAHTALPIKTECPVLYIEAHSSADINAPILDAINKLDDDVKTIGLVTTTQHIHKLDDMIEIFKSNGYTVVLDNGIGTSTGQVLGCNFTSIKNLNVDVIVYVGSGDFHALGVKLFTKKPVILADPFTGQARDIDKFYDKILRIRFARITKAKSAKSYGIIISSKKGQLRFELALKLRDLLEEHGLKAQILNMDYIAPDRLLPFNLDAFVMTACPRIAIDDSAMYKKPVITPQELEIVLGLRDWEDYMMDEIIIHDEQTD